MKKSYEQPQIEVVKFDTEVTATNIGMSTINASDMITCYSSEFDL